MRDTPRSQPKKVDRFSARLDVRIEPEFKKLFKKYCKDHRVISSDTLRSAIQQYILLGDFKTIFFEFLYKNEVSRKKFEDFLKSITLNVPGKDMVKANKIDAFFTDIIGVEEAKLIKDTPHILLQNIKNTIITSYGRKKFEERITGGS